MTDNNFYTLAKSGEHTYINEPGKAGHAGFAIDGVGFVRFDMIDGARITFLDIEDDADELILVSLVGWDQTSALLRGDDAVQITPSGTARRFAHLARLETIRRAPVMRSSRIEFDAATALIAQSLLNEELPSDQLESQRDQALSRLAAACDAREDAVQLARSNERLQQAIWLGVTHAGADECAVFLGIALDLPDPGDTTIEQVMLPTFTGSTAAGPGFQPEIVLPIRRGAVLSRDLEPRSQPLIWAHFGDESILPEDGGFSKAVEITQHGDEAEITVRGHAEHAAAVHARVFDADSELVSVATLTPQRDRWQGRLPLPDGFEPDTHRIEIVDSLRRASAYSQQTVDRQWAVLELARRAVLEPVHFVTY